MHIMLPKRRRVITMAHLSLTVTCHHHILMLIMGVTKFLTTRLIIHITTPTDGSPDRDRVVEGEGVNSMDGGPQGPYDDHPSSSVKEEDNNDGSNERGDQGMPHYVNMPNPPPYSAITIGQPRPMARDPREYGEAGDGGPVDPPGHNDDEA
eukprot:CAMPEP_0118700876 /NCGR_PEP_ID=MMETSP0800-20121206/16870_1 /TAXON_ID=210618 ORGANISM="Striatella unipunctata, Strain CCMP2910" /NCGR_SAMPLE_ID=MMETSP0800 /ASSEMBLY_ACC=CAM_ASM_000638 /LENGTH=150 /DNA_ID=CAMNT_0006601597 /DNA_START=78 /DNA_END=530 /DNA_ORIENTATION=-